MPMNAQQGGDPLDGMPPIPALRTASPNALSMPRPSAGSAAMALTGAQSTGSLIEQMMQLEQLVMEISKKLPALTNVASPFIQQMRDLGAAALADKASGGIGATNPEQSAPPPQSMGPGMGGPPPMPMGM